MKITRVLKKEIYSAIEPANISKLREQMQNDDNLKKLLTVPAVELLGKYPEYKYLLDDRSLSVNKERSLFHLIKVSCNLAQYCYFSLSGNKITGFFAYFLKDNIVTNIKILSLCPDNLNATLAKDVLNIIPFLTSQYKEVNWEAIPENPICKAYDKIIEKYNGSKETMVDEDGFEYIQYRIPGESK